MNFLVKKMNSRYNNFIKTFFQICPHLWSIRGIDDTAQEIFYDRIDDLWENYGVTFLPWIVECMRKKFSRILNIIKSKFSLFKQTQTHGPTLDRIISWTSELNWDQRTTERIIGLKKQWVIMINLNYTNYSGCIDMLIFNLHQ